MSGENRTIFDRKLSSNNESGYRISIAKQIINTLDLDQGEELHQHIHETEDGREGIFISPSHPQR